MSQAMEPTPAKRAVVTKTRRKSATGGTRDLVSPGEKLDGLVRAVGNNEVAELL